MRRHAHANLLARRRLSQLLDELKSKSPSDWPRHFHLAWRILHDESKVAEQPALSVLNSSVSVAHACGSTVDRLRKFPANPWDRISEEIHDGSLSTSPKHHRRIKPTDIDDYLAIILDGKNFSEEFAAFRKAWEGSIDFQRSNGNAELVKAAMPLKELDETISIFIPAIQVQTRGEPQPVHH